MGNQIYCATYMPDDGALLDYYILEYNGTELVKESCYFADGELDYCEEYETLADGTKYERRYDCDGQLIYCYQREFNDDGKEVSLTCYTYDGSIEWYCTYQYDNNGNYSGHTEFDNEGNITSATTYD